MKNCVVSRFRVKGLTSALIVYFEMSTHVGYSVYFHPVLGPFKAKAH